MWGGGFLTKPTWLTRGGCRRRATASALGLTSVLALTQTLIPTLILTLILTLTLPWGEAGLVDHAS